MNRRASTRSSRLVPPPCSRARRGGFTLIELVVTTVLAAVLLAALLTVTAGISWDRKRLAAAEGDGGAGASPGAGRAEAVLDLLRRDLTNARTLGQSPDGRSVVLVGNAGLSRASLAPDGRLARVTYRVRPARPARGERGRGGGSGQLSCLVREQRYLDDPSRPDPWTEVVAVGVRRLTVATASTAPFGEPADAAADAERLEARNDEPEPEDDPTASPGAAATISAQVRVRVEFDVGALDEVLWAR